MATLLPHVSLPQEQPECSRDAATLLYDCGAWEVSVRWSVPSDAASGVYLARLVRNDGEATWRTDNSQYPADARSAIGVNTSIITVVTPDSPFLTMFPESCLPRPSPGLTPMERRVTASSATTSGTPRPVSCTLLSGMIPQPPTSCSRPLTPRGRPTTSMAALTLTTASVRPSGGLTRCLTTDRGRPGPPGPSTSCLGRSIP